MIRRAAALLARRDPRLPRARRQGAGPVSMAGFKASNHPQQTGKRGARDDVDDRGTDQTVFDALSKRFGGFTLDVAAAPHNAKCEAYYTMKDDGLRMPWGSARWQGPTCFSCAGTGEDFAYSKEPIPDTPFAKLTRDVPTGLPCRACNGHGRDATSEDRTPEQVWCNPPYSDCGSWVRKAWSEWNNPWATRPDVIVMLLPANRVEQAWWQDHVEPFRDRPGSPLRVEFLRGRMRFDRPHAVIGPKGDRPPFGCCLLIWEAR